MADAYIESIELRLKNLFEKLVKTCVGMHGITAFISNRRLDMKVIAILLIVLGVVGFLLGSMMYGDIGISCFV